VLSHSANRIIDPFSTAMIFSRAFLVILSALSANAFVVPLNNNYDVAGARHTTSLQAAVDTSDIKNGMTVEIDGEPWKILSFSIMKQARGAAKTTIKFKNLQRGNTIENTYRSGEKFETAMIEKKKAQHTYKDDVSARDNGWMDDMNE
jgi:elongation factor P